MLKTEKFNRDHIIYRPKRRQTGIINKKSSAKEGSAAFKFPRCFSNVVGGGGRKNKVIHISVQLRLSFLDYTYMKTCCSSRNLNISKI